MQKLTFPRSAVPKFTPESSAPQLSYATHWVKQQEKWDSKKTGHRDSFSWFLWLRDGFPGGFWDTPPTPPQAAAATSRSVMGSGLGAGLGGQKETSGKTTPQPQSHSTHEGPLFLVSPKLQNIASTSSARHSPGLCKDRSVSELVDSDLSLIAWCRDQLLELPVLPFSRISLLLKLHF